MMMGKRRGDGQEDGDDHGAAHDVAEEPHRQGEGATDLAHDVERQHERRGPHIGFSGSRATPLGDAVDGHGNEDRRRPAPPWSTAIRWAAESRHDGQGLQTAMKRKRVPTKGSKASGLWRVIWRTWPRMTPPSIQAGSATATVVLRCSRRVTSQLPTSRTMTSQVKTIVALSYAAPPARRQCNRD